jgi:hypothetical protein
MGRYPKEDIVFFKNRIVQKPMDLTNIKNLPFKERLVTADESGRPDIISLKEYGTPDFYYIILFANDIEFNEVITGKKIKIPILQ